MKNRALIICAVTAVLLSGCTKSNILTSQGPAEPVFETQEGIVLDWTQIGNDMDEEFVHNEQYPMSLSVNYQVDPEKKSLELTLLVKPGTTPEEAVIFADAAMRYLNDSVAMQDFSFERSSETSYGGFFKDYSVNLIVMPDYTMNQKQYWLVDMDIPAGSDEKIVSREGAEVMETETEDEYADEEETDPGEGEEEADGQEAEETQAAQ